MRSSVDEYALNSRRTEVAERVVFASQARCEDAVHIHVRHGIGLSRGAVAEILVDSPYVQAAWNFLVLALYAVRATEFVSVCVVGL